MALPLLFLPPRLPLSISLPRFTSFLLALRAPLPLRLLSTSRPPTALDLARALWGVPASPDFSDAIDLLDLLSSPTGAPTPPRAARRPLPLRLPPADLAAVLLTLHASDPAAFEPLLERTLHTFARVVPRHLPLELVARAPRAAADPALLVRALESILGPRRFVAAWYATDDATGSLHVAVVRRARAHAAVGPARGAALVPARRLRRDFTVDTIRVDVPDGRVILRCDPDDPSLESAYAAAVATSLFGDPSYFADTPAYTFKTVVLLGSEGLAAKRPPGVSRMRVVDITWDDGEGSTLNAHGSDALAAFERRGGAGGGYVTGAMYRIDAPVSSHPIDVAIRLPDRAFYRSARHERLARAALASVGSLAPGAVADDSFTLAPWIHAEWRWRKLLGDALFDSMVAAKLLVRVKTRMVGDPAMGKYGWSYVAFDLRSEPGKQYAVAMDPRLPSRDLEGDERRMWRLDPAAVGRALARDLGAEPAPPDAAIGSAALDLGTVRDAIDLRFFAVLRSPGPAAPALVQAMVRASGASHLVVLLPEGRTLGGAGGVEIGLGIAELFGQEPITAKTFTCVAEKKGVGGRGVAACRAGHAVRHGSEDGAHVARSVRARPARVGGAHPPPHGPRRRPARAVERPRARRLSAPQRRRRRAADGSPFGGLAPRCFRLEGARSAQGRG